MRAERPDAVMLFDPWPLHHYRARQLRANLKRAGAPTWFFGLVFVAHGFGSFVGNTAAARVRSRFTEAQMLAGSVLAGAGVSAIATLAANRAGTLDIRPLLAATDNLVYRSPRGSITVRNGHARMPMYLAEADGLDFRVIKAI